MKKSIAATDRPSNNINNKNNPLLKADERLQHKKKMTSRNDQIERGNSRVKVAGTLHQASPSASQTNFISPQLMKKDNQRKGFPSQSNFKKPFGQSPRSTQRVSTSASEAM